MRHPMVEEMNRRGWSYRDLGHASGYSAPFLCRVAHGHRRPSRQAQVVIAKALGVSPRRLWGATPGAVR